MLEWMGGSGRQLDHRLRLKPDLQTDPAARQRVGWRHRNGPPARKARQHLQGFLLRHGRIYSGKKGWTVANRRWLTAVRFDHPAQQIVFQDYVDAVGDAEKRAERLTAQIADLLPSWSLAPVVEAIQSMRRVAFIVAVTVVAEGRGFPTVRQSASADSISRAHTLRAFERSHRSPRRDHESRQWSRPKGLDRRCPELPHAGSRQP